MDTTELREILERSGVPKDIIASIVEKNGRDPLVGEVPHVDAELSADGPAPAPVVIAAEVVSTSAPDSSRPVPEAEGRPEFKTAMVEFKGSMIMVKMPTLEQITIIRRLAHTFGQAAKEQLTAERAVKLMNRAVQATCAVVARPEDVETVEDLMLDGAKFEDLMPLIVAAMDELRRANKPLTTKEPSGASLETGQ